MANERKRLSELQDLRIDDVEEATEEKTDKNSTQPETTGQAAEDVAVEPEKSAGGDGATSLKFEFSEEIGGGLRFTGEADISPEPESMKKSETADASADGSEEGENETKADGSQDGYIEDLRNIRPTYVPRFTSFSENYRARVDSRFNQKDENESVKVTVGEVDASAEKNETVGGAPDPTAEFNSQDDVEKIVVPTAPAKEKDSDEESFTVYKFESPSAELDRKTVPLAAELPDPLEREEETDAPVESEPLVEEIAEAAEKVEPEYFMPDPESKFKVIEYSSQKKNDGYSMEDPEGAHDFVDSKGGFSSPIQRDFVKDRFLDSLMAVKVRLVAACVLFLGLLVVEILGVFGIGVNDLLGLGVNFAASAVVDFIFVGCMFLLAIPELLRSVKYLVKKIVVPELYSVASILVLGVYTIVISAIGAPEYSTFGLLFGIQIIASIVGTYLRLKAEFAAFKIVSKNTVKRVIDKKFTRDLPRENLALDGIIDEYNSKCARMFRTAFVSDFDKHAEQVAENSKGTLFTMAVGAGVALVSGIVAFFIHGFSAAMGIQSFAMVFLTACPAFTILSHKLPYRASCIEAEQDECAFVGEQSFYDCADIDVLTYEDTEVFGAEDVSLRKVHLYGKAYNAPKAMKQMYALFANIGGPLDRLFSESLDRKCQTATDVVLEDDGISGMHEGHSICAGSEEYMRNHGVTIPSDDYRASGSSNDSTKIMYGAEDGVVYVKFFIRYSFSEEFTMSLPYFKEEKIVPLIYTRDPNVNLELIRVLTSGEDIIRILKRGVPQAGDVKTYRRISSGLVTLGEKADAFNMVFLAKRYTKLQNELAEFEKISLVSGVALSVVMSLIPAFSVPAIGLAFWQLAWCLLLVFKSKTSFKTGKKDKGN